MLIAPDSFKGTYTATEVGAVLARGARRVGARADEAPVADGGEGTASALLPSGGTVSEHRVHDPLMRPVTARIQWDDHGRTAIVEVADASGLARVPATERDAEAASTYGTGELIAIAAAGGADRIFACAGGSATSDGGAGALTAIHDAGGIGEASLVVLCDVDVPFEQAATVFGAQKGADTDAIRRLTDRLHAQARTMERDPRGVPMTGAAGGLAGGLWSALGATLAPGARHVIAAVGIDARLDDADVLVGGEGRLDHQSTRGKIVGTLAAHASRAGVPFVVVVGSSLLDHQDAQAAGIDRVYVASTIEELEAVGARIARDYRRGEDR